MTNTNKYYNRFNNLTTLQEVTKSINFLRDVIETEEQYVQWVRQWKSEHKELVEAINAYRAVKDAAKASADPERVTKMNIAQYNKKSLGTLASDFYEQRTNNKALLKAIAIDVKEAA